MSEVEQGTPEWFAQRCGKATASRISDIVAKTKTGYSTKTALKQCRVFLNKLSRWV